MMGDLFLFSPSSEEPCEEAQHAPRAVQRKESGVHDHERLREANEEAEQKLCRICVIFRTSDEGSRKPA